MFVFGLSRRIDLCMAATVSMIIVFGLSRAEVLGAEWRKQPKTARQEGSLVRCHFERARSIMYGNNSEYEYCLWSFASEVRGAKWRNLLYTEKKDFSTARSVTAALEMT